MAILYISVFLLLLCILAFAHTYFLFPLSVGLLGRKKKTNVLVFGEYDNNLPSVAVIFSCFNEEKVIRRKLENCISVNYPKSKLTFFIGSDASTDGTNHIINEFIKEHKEINFLFCPSDERRGKPGVINELAMLARDHEVFVLTDADVMLQPDTVFLLSRHFKNPSIGIVDSNLQNLNKDNDISSTEGLYMGREAMVKFQEGLIWGLALGPSGGCYAIRASLFSPVPKGYLVDDFYIAMKIIEMGYKSICEPSALSSEHSPGSLSVEFKRKTRIATGNFKNLETFAHLLLPSKGTLAWVFWSHKVLRWIGPFLLLTVAICIATIAACLNHPLMWFVFAGMISAVPLVWFLCFISDKLNLKIPLLKPLWYFIYMNIALANGFFKYLKGNQTSTWQPTKRL